MNQIINNLPAAGVELARAEAARGCFGIYESLFRAPLVLDVLRFAGVGQGVLDGLRSDGPAFDAAISAAVQALQDMGLCLVRGCAGPGGRVRTLALAVLPRRARLLHVLKGVSAGDLFARGLDALHDLADDDLQALAVRLGAV